LRKVQSVRDQVRPASLDPAGKAFKPGQA